MFMSTGDKDLWDSLSPLVEFSIFIVDRCFKERKNDQSELVIFDIDLCYPKDYRALYYRNN